MVHPDLDALFDEMLRMAHLLLEKNGEFYPIGASMNSDGEIAHLAGFEGDEHPASQTIIDLIKHGLRAQASESNLRAGAICYDVRTVPPGASKKTDAICVDLAHVEGEAVKVLEPYRKGWFGKIAYGEIFAARGDLGIFGADGGVT